jgi:hypothetical protein
MSSAARFTLDEGGGSVEFSGLRESGLTHAVALHTPSGRLEIVPVEIMGAKLIEWRNAADPGTATEIFVYILETSRTAEILSDPAFISRIEACCPVLLAVGSEEDADLIAEALRGHLARLNASHGRH